MEKKLNQKANQVAYNAVLDEADKRGHRHASEAAAYGSFVGGLLGSFFGPIGVMIGAATFGAVAHQIGAEKDKEVAR